MSELNAIEIGGLIFAILFYVILVWASFNAFADALRKPIDIGGAGFWLFIGGCIVFLGGFALWGLIYG